MRKSIKKPVMFLFLGAESNWESGPINSEGY